MTDNEHAALELEDIANPMDRRGSSGWAYICRGAARRLRADAEEIARLKRIPAWSSAAPVEELELALSELAVANARIAELEADVVQATYVETIRPTGTMEGRVKWWVNLREGSEQRWTRWDGTDEDLRRAVREARKQ